jgi:hypothetical protein
MTLTMIVDYASHLYAGDYELQIASVDARW